MIERDNYIRIVLGLKSGLRWLHGFIGMLPLTVDMRSQLLKKLHAMDEDVYLLYVDLKEQKLVD